MHRIYLRWTVSLVVITEGNIILHGGQTINYQAECSECSRKRPKILATIHVSKRYSIFKTKKKKIHPSAKEHNVSIVIKKNLLPISVYSSIKRSELPNFFVAVYNSQWRCYYFKIWRIPSECTAINVKMQQR